LKVIFRTISGVIIVLLRQIFYRIKRKKIDFKKAGLDAPIGIVGQSNAITWDVENLILVKITIGSKNKFTVKDNYQFINSVDNNNIKVSFYGIDQILLKTFTPHLILIKKDSTPVPVLNKKVTGELKNVNYELGNYKPKIRNDVSIVGSRILVKQHHLEVKNLNVSITGVDTSELITEITKRNEELEYEKLTKNDKDENNLLPKPYSRPYHEIIMESRWFR
jgi:hypothetical protein